MRTGKSDFFEGSLMPESDAAPAGPNPYWQGCRVVDRDDLFPKGFSQVELDATYAGLANDAHDLGLLLESPSLDELDHYNPGREEVEESYVLEAITVEHFSRTERRMAAVVRVLNRYLSDSEITALSPVVGKPKKSGSFAYVVVQLPFSDGQTVNVVFHSPEGDKKRIGPSDAIIAFRWLLNKRDITHVVAPEDGEEVSLETIAKRITQLVVKNSARFERQQKAAQAERKELNDAREAVKNAEERQSDLMDKISSKAKEAESIEARLSNTLSLLEKQKTINAELQAKIDALRKARGGGKPTLGTNGAGQTSGQTGQGGQEGKWPQRESTAKDIDVFSDGYQSGKYEQNPYLLTSDRSDAFVLGVWAKQNGKLPPKKIKKSRGLTWKVDDSVYIVDEKDVTLKSGPGMANGSLTGIDSQSAKENLGIDLDETRSGSGGSQLPTQGARHAPDGTVDKDGVYIKHDGWWYTRGKDGQAKDRLAVSFQDRLEKEWRDSQGKPAGAENPTEPSFVNDLRDIIDGKYDADTEKILSLLEAAITAAEKDGTLEKYDAMLNEASNHLTDLLAKEAA